MATPTRKDIARRMFLDIFLQILYDIKWKDSEKL